MNVVLLAAGRGSRLGDLTRDKPKCLAPLHGRPLLDWLLATLTAAGLREFYVVSGYRGELLVRPNMSRIENPRWQETNMVSSLCCARDVLRQGDTIVSYTDILYTPETVKRLVLSPGPIALTFDPDWLVLWRRRFADPRDDAEQFQMDPEGNVTAIGGRIHDLAEATGQYMGLLKFTPEGWRQVEEVLDSFPPDRAGKLDMTALLAAMLEHGAFPIRAVPATGGWCEIDSESDVAIGEEFVRDRLVPALSI